MSTRTTDRGCRNFIYPPRAACLRLELITERQDPDQWLDLHFDLLGQEMESIAARFADGKWHSRPALDRESVKLVYAPGCIPLSPFLPTPNSIVIPARSSLAFHGLWLVRCLCDRERGWLSYAGFVKRNPKHVTRFSCKYSGLELFL